MPCWLPLPEPKNATLAPLMAGAIGSVGLNEVKLPAPFGIAVFRSATLIGESPTTAR